MSNYVACIKWSLRAGSAQARSEQTGSQQESEFGKGRYSRSHVWDFDGLPGVPASSSPQVVPLPWSQEQAIDPEEAFVASVASCDMLWFLALASEAGLAVTGYYDRAEGRLGKNEAGQMAMIDIWLRPRVTLADVVGVSAASLPLQTTQSARADVNATGASEALLALHEEAHRRCFIANSIRSRIHLLPE